MLKRRTRELARSNAELVQFASIASHHLQEPLRRVRRFTQQLTVIEAGRLSETGQDYLQRTNAAAERMQKLIEDLLKFSRVATRGEPFAPVDLNQLTYEVLGDLEAQLTRSGAVAQVGELPTIWADQLQMRQLMQNLISNAIKFRRPGVTPEIEIASSLDGVRAAITVRATALVLSLSTRSASSASSASSSGSMAAANIPGPGSVWRCAARSPSGLTAPSSLAASRGSDRPSRSRFHCGPPARRPSRIGGPSRRPRRP